MPGSCGLCKAEGVSLCYSDLLPKAISRWLIKSELIEKGNRNPVFITSRRAVQMNFRVAEEFLCLECEGRLNRQGETWVLRNSYRGVKNFPIQSLLADAPPIAVRESFRLIDGRALPDVEMDKLVFFATSIFWKASAREWRFIDHWDRLEFGPYEEKFRSFLNHEADFPDSVSLVISVSGNPNPHVGAIYPYMAARVSGTRQFRFSIPGMAFWLHQGNLPEHLKEFCAHRTGRICFVPDLNKIYLDEAMPMIANAKPSGVLGDVN